MVLIAPHKKKENVNVEACSKVSPDSFLHFTHHFLKRQTKFYVFILISPNKKTKDVLLKLSGKLALSYCYFFFKICHLAQDQVMFLNDITIKNM